jgi:hypothetical protein
MLLKDKNAVIYGAGGAIDSAVARAFAPMIGEFKNGRGEFLRLKPADIWRTKAT